MRGVEYQVAAAAVLLGGAAASGSSFGDWDPSQIVNDISNMVVSFFDTIFSAISSAVGSVATSLGNGFSNMVYEWTGSFGPYGVWIPIVLVVVVCVALLVAYFLADIIGAEKDVLGAEEGAGQ